MENVATVSFGIAFMFGLFSFFSPCVLPLLPGYLSFIAGVDLDGGQMPTRHRALGHSICFVLGFSFLFIAMGAAASGLGQWFIKNQILLARVAGIFIIFFGLHISELLPIKFLYRNIQWQPKRMRFSWLGAAVFGLAFAAGWTPCVGPVLASILLLAGSLETMLQGILLLSFYSLGLALPFLLAAWSIDTIYRRLTGLTRLLPYINAVSGGVLIVLGILLVSGLWNQVMTIFY